MQNKEKFRRVRLAFSDDNEQELELRNSARLEDYPLRPTTATSVRITCVAC